MLLDMTDTPASAQDEVPAQDESLFGTVDLILLFALLVGGLYWLFKRNRKEEKPVTRSYAIQ